MISKSFILLAVQTALATAAAVQGNAGLDKRYLAVEPAAESTNGKSDHLCLSSKKTEKNSG